MPAIIAGPLVFFMGKNLEFSFNKQQGCYHFGFLPNMYVMPPLYTTVGPYTYRNGSTIHIYPAQYALSQIFWSWKKFWPRSIVVSYTKMKKMLRVYTQ